MTGLMRMLAWVGVVVMGAVAAVFGTAIHRGAVPWGLVVAVVAVGVTSLFARALVGLGGLAVFAVTWLGFVLAMTYVRPGGDVLVVPGALGYVWMFAPLVLVGVVAFLPRRWFLDAPVPVVVRTEDVGPSV